ncbi:RbsD/FucU domain-containing protein [Variovorax sp. PCZ-1]|uniref:RbsD/FucU family protein n=1 Tax=Variovorax sp. PCZ-1 TaxID=2835533 RepID=UPI001BD13D5C|nr:RbsD/FucU domain-containing protein [Variovorax sp. PCZ-1]MBS7806103.1 RbsD or FucU transport [Variovorax sp. PCZ-1]
MLKNIDPVLCPELLKALAEMGHEDSIVLADANFTAMRYRSQTTSQVIIRLPGVSLLRAAQAVLSVLPLGIPKEQPVAYMHASESPAGYRNAAQEAVYLLVHADPANRGINVQALERFAFYEQAQKAYVIVQTGETAAYANFIFKKGVLTSDAGL